MRLPGLPASHLTVQHRGKCDGSGGPGIRTTVFLKGCPLRCPWCHNPEGIAAGPEVTVVENRCLDCGLCIEACPHDIQPSQVPGPSLCTLCGSCADTCPTAARQVVGRPWTVNELMETVLRDRIFYDSSGGGVTFSGGEPLNQAEFLIESLRACREQRLHTTVDTSGCAPRSVLLEVAEICDLMLFDLKLMDEERHRELLGVPLAPILANLEAVTAAATCTVWLRVPVVPGFTDAPYTNFANINLGGLLSDGSDGSNELAHLLLEIIRRTEHCVL